MEETRIGKISKWFWKEISGVYPLDVWKISFGNECTHYRRLFFESPSGGDHSMFLYSLNKIEIGNFSKVWNRI